MKTTELKKIVEVHEDVVREAELIDNKELRDKLADRLDALDKIGKLFLLPEIFKASTTQVAEYYKVNTQAIQKVWNKSKEEIVKDGVELISSKDAEQRLFHIGTNVKTRNYFAISIDGTQTMFANRGTRFFSKRAILRIGMLLRDSEVAKEVRTQLLNTFEHATDDQRLAELTEEQRLTMNLGKAIVHGSREDEREAWKQYTRHQDRYVKCLEQRNKEIEAENDALASQTLTTDMRLLLNRMIRKLAHSAFGGSWQMAWNTFYKELHYQKHISLRKRCDGTGNLIDFIHDDEWRDAIAVAASMCKKNHIDFWSFLLEDDVRTICEATGDADCYKLKSAEKQWDAAPDYYEARGIKASFANM